MARSDAAWGIDIGNSSLKALRCRPDKDDPSQVVSDAFDYIEYPKILTQPDADPAVLIADAIQQFLSRNVVRGDRVSISVSGQNGLARFIKLPPVESKKIPDIVRYEAKQQIPFDLDDVVWDYQQMGGGSEEEGFALETEIGLFAMKRDQVFRALEPFRVAGIEVDVVQLTPLALFNYLAFDQMYDLPPIDEYDPDNPPGSTVILSMGTDATDLVVTNGYRVWQRSIPLGGNHFTKALTKDLKLTFAKAEHLKRNATAAEDPKAVFQSMRPVFNDLLTEIQRSIGYFTTIERNAHIEHVVTLGNALKLPGLRRYLAQSLGHEVPRIESFRGLVGNEVVNAPAFKENLLCYGVSYGLALQGLGKSSLWTNLLPKELVKDRLIREKKPWAVAAVAVLLTGLAVSFVGYSIALGTVDNQEFDNAKQGADRVIANSKDLHEKADSLEAAYNDFKVVGENLVGNVEGRIMWLELLQAINSCMPQEPQVAPNAKPKEIGERNELHLTNLECQRMDSIDSWLTVMKQNSWYKKPKVEEEANEGESESNELGESELGDTESTTTPANEAPEDGSTTKPWLIQITGYHYHNRGTADGIQGPDFVKQTLIANLENHQLLLPVGDADAGGERRREMVSMKDLGIQYPSLVNPGRIQRGQTIYPPGIDPSNSGSEGGLRAGGVGGQAEDKDAKKPQTVHRFDFVVQFIWTPTPPTLRHAKQDAEAEAEANSENDNPSTDS